MGSRWRTSRRPERDKTRACIHFVTFLGCVLSRVFILFRPNPNEHFTGNLKSVRPFKPFKLFRDLCPGPFSISLVQPAHELPGITGAFFHVFNSGGSRREPSLYRNSANRHIQKISLACRLLRALPALPVRYCQGSPGAGAGIVS